MKLQQQPRIFTEETEALIAVPRIELRTAGPHPAPRQRLRVARCSPSRYAGRGTATAASPQEKSPPSLRGPVLSFVLSLSKGLSKGLQKDGIRSRRKNPHSPKPAHLIGKESSPPCAPCPEPVEGRGWETTRSGVGWGPAKIPIPTLP